MVISSLTRLQLDPTMTEPMRRIEEILEIAEILDEAADRLATVLERSGADRLHPPEALREMAHYELVGVKQLGCYASPINT